MPAIVDIVHRFASENSPYTREVLNNAVIVVIPAANPDGWRKMADHFAATANTTFGRTYPDLYHHFAGHDNNRDWFLFTQTETQHRIRMNQRFNPVVEHFMHQQGATGSRIFVPPWAEPVSPNLDPIAHESGNALGLEIGKYLTADGYKGVQHSMGTQNSYGIMYSADVATYGSWRGSSLLLTETAGQRDLAYPFTNGNPLGPQGRSMDVPDPYRGTTWTLEQASRVRQGRALRTARVRSPATGGLAGQLALPHDVEVAHGLGGRAVRLRAARRAARPVRGLRDAGHVREGQGRDRPRHGAVHRRRQELSRGLLRPAARSSRSAASSTSCSTTRPTRTGRGRARRAR